jgi:anti-sigma factor RsiW
VPCAESLRVQAYFDREVDSLSAAEIERHVESCAECRAWLDDLQRMRAALRGDTTYHRAGPELRQRIMSAIDRESSLQENLRSVADIEVSGAGASGAEASIPGASGAGAARTGGKGARVWRLRPFWAGALGGFGSAAIAAGLAFLVLMPPAANAVLDELVSAHVRSLMPTAQLIDVQSTDRHTVKPWFAGHADVSPVVVDFAAQGYRLIGGRADYLERQRAAAVVYQHGAHFINVFSWAADGGALPPDATRNGYHIACWRAGNLDYCAVSDTGWDELNGLVRLLRETSAAEAPEAHP